MSKQSLNSVTGPIALDDLGTTMMHEHVIVSFPGWDADTLRPGYKREEMVAIVVDKIQEMQALGIQSMVDPCPSDLGRDVELSAEISARTGFNIICATGLYNEAEGGHAYWQFPRSIGIGVERMAELFIHELTKGIGETDIKAGLIKVASGEGAITDYEYDVLSAAAIASKETGAPITTHTEKGTMGREQQAFLMEKGVPAQKIVIGHSCGSSDNGYHTDIVGRGSYLGFDRFGLNILESDEARIDALMALLEQNHEKRIVVSHDCVWCRRGHVISDEMMAELGVVFDPTHFHRVIMPQLLERGASREQIETMLVDNPRRYFAGEA